MKFLIGMLFSLVVFTNGMAAAPGPEDLIKQTADRVLAEIKTNSKKYEEDIGQLYDFVDRVVLPHFDFDAMTDLALGKYESKIDAAQKPLVTAEFRTLLVRTYGKALLEYNDQVIVYKPMQGSVGDGEVVVRTEIEQPGGFPIPLDYRLKLGDKGWKVYDISVDDISLVTNYRSSFARQIRKEGVDGLINLLKERNEQQ